MRNKVATAALAAMISALLGVGALMWNYYGRRERVSVSASLDLSDAEFASSSGLERAKRELEYLGLGKPAEVADGVVLRVPKAYPVYDGTYQRGLGMVRRFLETVPNLQLIGRNGMHRYNNQDHSMLTGILAARNLLGLGKHDLWEVNADEEYHEDGFLLSHEEIEGLALSQPATPAPVSSGLADTIADHASR